MNLDKMQMVDFRTSILSLVHPKIHCYITKKQDLQVGINAFLLMVQAESSNLWNETAKGIEDTPCAQPQATL